MPRRRLARMISNGQTLQRHLALRRHLAQTIYSAVPIPFLEALGMYDLVPGGSFSQPPLKFKFEIASDADPREEPGDATPLPQAPKSALNDALESPRTVNVAAVEAPAIGESPKLDTPGTPATPV